MKRSSFLSKPIKLADLTFDDLYEDANSQAQHKIDAMQTKRMRALKRAIKGRAVHHIH